MEEIRFDIVHPDARREQIVVCAPRAIIGTGAHCDVRLAVDQAAFEHVVIELQADGMRVQNLSPMPPAALNGVPFQMVTVGHQAALFVGSTHIQITRQVAAGASGKSKLGTGTLARGLLLIMIPLALLMLGKQAKPEAAVPADPPRIFATEAARCPRRDPGEARVFAQDQRLLADAARERSPFEPREALSAVTAYETAHACLRLAGLPDEAQDALAAADAIREATLVELRMRQLRLERALRTGDWEIAAGDAAVLRSLTEGKASDYEAWLADAQREIQAQNSRNQR